MRIDNPNAEKDFQEYVAQKLGIIENEIRRLSNEYILNVRQEEYINMFSLPLSLPSAGRK